MTPWTLITDDPTTYPESGLTVLCLLPDNEPLIMAAYTEDGEIEWRCDGDLFDGDPPWCWMPIPDPPEVTDG